MQVSRLEIFGFKSFMERLILPVKDGITGVVGPNGCGKSNIVDALRWVLGETNARSLRGGLLEDIIFNGTDKFRPLGLAEVSLTISSRGESLYDDIAFTQQEGELQAQLDEAEEQIKDVSSKLKKLKKHAEGKADSEAETIIVSQPEEAKEAEGGEEVVRQSPPKLRVISRGESVEDDSEGEEQEATIESEEAEQKSVSRMIVSEQVLNQKFGWLKGVSEVQVTRRLYRSGEAEFFLNRTPCRLRDLKEFFRVVGISARTFTIVAQGEVARIITAKPDQRRQIFEEAAGVLGLRDKISASERRLKDTADNVARLEDIEREVERQVNSLKRQANKARRRGELRDELHGSEQKLFSERLRRSVALQNEAANQLRILEEEEHNLLQNPEGASATEETLRTELLQTEIFVEELREKLDHLKEEAHQRGRKEESLKGTQHELKALFEAKGTEGKRVTERLHTLLERERASKDRITELEGREGSLREQLEKLEAESSELLLRLEQELQELRGDLKSKEGDLQNQREQLSKIAGELEATQKQMRESSRLELLDPESGGERTQEIRSIFERIEGELPQVLAELIEVEPQYTKAIQTALGERASYFVVTHAADIAEAFESVRNERRGQEDESDNFWYGLLQPVAKAATNMERAGGDHPHAVPAERLVKTDPDTLPLVQNLLQGVFIVPKLEDGLRLLRSDSLPRDVLLVTEAGEKVSSEEISLPKMESGLLDLQQRITELRSYHGSLTEDFETAAGALKRKEEQLVEKEQAHRAALQAKQESEQQARELSREIGSVKGYLSAEAKVLEQIEQDIERSREHELELQGRVKELEDNQIAVQAELESLLKEDSSGLHSELQILGDKLQSKDSERRSLRERFEEARSLAEAERRQLDEVRQKLATKRLDLERAKMEESHVQESILEKLPEEYRSGVTAEGEAIDDDAFSTLERKAAEVRAQLLREGEVDPTSIERYEEESKRLEELRAQKSDLESASRTLRKTVQLLRDQSVERFVATFEEVKEHFVTLMPRLFGGGSADLELIDPNDPLESGIAIIVRPPGKKPKSLDLLSGGEKALCATALIVSLFLVHPSPLCVLDEVDAPLDEANLVRFLSLVKEMSSHTQFLLITHNKASMAAADRLVGVTMQRPGASSVLTVSLEEAAQHAA